MRGQCPTLACRTTGGRTVPFAACASCAKARTSLCTPQRPCQLYCTKCKPGYSLYPLDTFNNECLRPAGFQCAQLDADSDGSAYGLSGPCLRCRPGGAAVYATNFGWWEWADAYFSAKRVCRTCAQLGCPLACRQLAGCTACPAGSVLLATGPPLGTRHWIGANNFYFVGKAPPQLPSVCRTVRSLGCAAGKAKSRVGCTACPPGKKLRAIRPEFIPGSRFIQLRPLGKACS